MGAPQPSMQCPSRRLRRRATRRGTTPTAQIGDQDSDRCANTQGGASNNAGNNAGGQGAMSSSEAYRTLRPTLTAAKPLAFCGAEGHLQPIMVALQPNQNDRATRVEVKKVAV